MQTTFTISLIGASFFTSFPSRISALIFIDFDHLEKVASAAADAEALRRDRILHPKRDIDRRGKPVWDGSEAQRALRRDVRAQRDEELGFKKLYESNLAYQVFDRITFRQHIGQEKRRELYIAYLKSKKLAEKSKKKSKKSK